MLVDELQELPCARPSLVELTCGVKAPGSVADRRRRPGRAPEHASQLVSASSRRSDGGNKPAMRPASGRISTRSGSSCMSS